MVSRYTTLVAPLRLCIGPARPRGRPQHWYVKGHVPPRKKERLGIFIIETRQFKDCCSTPMPFTVCRIRERFSCYAFRKAAPAFSATNVLQSTAVAATAIIRRDVLRPVDQTKSLWGAAPRVVQQPGVDARFIIVPVRSGFRSDAANSSRAAIRYSSRRTEADRKRRRRRQHDRAWMALKLVCVCVGVRVYVWSYRRAP